MLLRARSLRRPRLAALLAVFWLLPTAHAAPEWNPLTEPAAAEEQIARLIVRLRPIDAESPAVPRPAAQRIESLGLRSRQSMHLSRSVTADIHVLRLLVTASATELEPALAALRDDADILYVQADRRRFAHAGAPDDPLFAGTPGIPGQTGQWYMDAPQSTPQGTTTAAVNAVGAWVINSGTAGVVIADLDTGVRFDHPDLLRSGAGGKLLPGYDFVGADGGTQGGSGSTYLTANDGDGWDDDPSDPGDWISTPDTQKSLFSKCTVANSSWHGTRTAGILGALTNNGVGIAGMAWKSWVLPVRVLGKCGGYDSDIIAGMLWAAGISVNGAPPNQWPAKVLNMSLGGAGSCAAVGGYQDAIDQVLARGAIVVVSVGNQGGPVDAPANCVGAIAVTGVRHVGTKVGYANLGPEVVLAAPAGNCVNTTAGSPCLFSIDTTVNLGTTIPAGNSYTSQQNPNVGTSFSAPIVSGIAALMLSVNGNLTPSQLRQRLKAGTRAFPVSSDPTVPMCAKATGSTSEAIECNCTTSTCGAGLADAKNAVDEALRPIAALALPVTISAGATVTLNAAGSAASCGSNVSSYAWSILASSTAGGSPALSADSGSSTSVSAPASGTVDVQLIVTDQSGRTDTATVAITASSAATTAPANAGRQACLSAVLGVPPVAVPAAPQSHGGGGGALDARTLALLATTISALRRTRRGRDRARAVTTSR